MRQIIQILKKKTHADRNTVGNELWLSNRGNEEYLINIVSWHIFIYVFNKSKPLGSRINWYIYIFFIFFQRSSASPGDREKYSEKYNSEKYVRTRTPEVPESSKKRRVEDKGNVRFKKLKIIWKLFTSSYVFKKILVHTKDRRKN